MKIKYEVIKQIIIFLFVFILPISMTANFVFAQSQSTAAEIETLLQSNTITYAQAARFILDAAEIMTTADSEEAFNYVLTQKWLPKNTNADSSARLDRVSLLLMNSFKIEGGLFFKLTKAPRYAYRELLYLDVIQGRNDPTMSVSGERLLFYITRILSRQDEKIAMETRRREQREESELMAQRRALAAQISRIIRGQNLTDTKVEATEEGVIIIFSNIMFEADSAVLPQAELEKIREIAGVLKSIPNIKLHITGHTTHLGAEDYLLKLSEERARAVANYLVSLNAAKMQNITIEGYGASRPIADSSAPEGLAANRRVEITILE
ncbi:MAG: OmpA family protein [Treponema sp.]|nr:OmpA family protein [Treponema sp.]MCL2250741.1 OmpA family protein [Treponema sp.]